MEKIDVVLTPRLDRAEMPEQPGAHVFMPSRAGLLCRKGRVPART
jgi:hypothetical protein